MNRLDVTTNKDNDTDVYGTDIDVYGTDINIYGTDINAYGTDINVYGTDDDVYGTILCSDTNLQQSKLPNECTTLCVIIN